MNSAHYKNLLSKWLFSALLITSFFTVGGFISQTQTNPRKPQTTLTVGSGAPLVKSISYKRALKSPQPQYLSLFSFVDADYLYTQQVKVRTTELSATVLPLQTKLFYKVKTISQNRDDEPYSLIG